MGAMETGPTEPTAKIPERGAQMRYLIDDSSKVGEARRAAHALANFELKAGLADKVSIAATELANNLLLHARGGELLIQTLGTDTSKVVELLAIDRGPGMTDVSRCMSDGYSTGGTPGTGLGAVRRLAREFDIYSAPGEGTIVMARFGATNLRLGAVSVAMPGEIECGDAWDIVTDANGTAVIVVDGLGHGTFAAEAARTCISAFQSAPDEAPRDILQRAHRSMSKTRGGGAAVARFSNRSLAYAGVGNISGYLVSAEKSQGLVSHNGTLGLNHRPAQQLEYGVAPGALLIMHSDGLSARWDLRQNPGLMRAHPALIAAALYRDHGRNNDDATVVVIAT
jgi:anti-sigma regulatory factor (Ser/Thr protein kinase)